MSAVRVSTGNKRVAVSLATSKITSDRITLTRGQAIDFGMVFLPQYRLERERDRPLEILKRLTGINSGIIPDLVKLDPEEVAKQIREDGVGTELLKHLGIAYTRSKGKVIVTPEITAQLLKLFAFLQPLDQASGNRIKVIKNDPEGLAEAGFKSKNIAGSVLIRINDTESGPRLHFHQDIYSLFRKTFHQGNQHDKELKLASDLIQRADKAVAMLAAWKTLEDHEKTKLQDESKGLALGIKNSLGSPRNKSKKRAIEIGFSAINLTVSGGNLNILVSKTRYATIADHLLSRVSGVSSIDSYNRQDRVSLLAAILEQETILRQIATRAKKTKDLVAGFVVSKKPNLDGYLLSLGMHGDAISRLTTRPWIVFRERLLSDRANFLLVAERKKGQESEDAIVKIEHLGALVLSEMALKGAKFHLISGQAGAEAAIVKIEEAKKHLQGYKFAEPFNALAGEFDLAIEKCRLLIKAKGVKLIGKVLKDAKDTLDLVGIEQRFFN